jgi:hypothetical protein
VLIQDSIEGFTTWILKNEDGSTLVTSQRQRPCGPSGIEVGRQGVFVFESPQILRGRPFSSYHQDGHLVAALSATMESEVRSPAKLIQYVLGILCH